MRIPCKARPFPRALAPNEMGASFQATARWPTNALGVGFLEPVPVKLAQGVLAVMSEWSKVCGMRFAYQPWPQAQVRITVAGSDWSSAVGTEGAAYPQNQPTMYLGGLTLANLAGNRPGILHETWHVLGGNHESQRPEVVVRIIPAMAYKIYWDWYGWAKPDVDAFVLTPLDRRIHWFGPGPPDSDSISAYDLPAEMMRDHKAFGGTGTGISPADARMAAIAYPKPKKKR